MKTDSDAEPVPAGAEWPEALLEQLRAADTVVALTGAGMSAESGIPTFRDALTGHWARFRAEELATPEAFAANPGRVWDWYESRRAGVRAATPHAGHRALAALEAVLPGLKVVTQNVDGFHQLAGSTRVIELHGNILRSVCSVTGRIIPEEYFANNSGNPPPSPHHPDGLCRPDVVWFGESLPEAALEAAFELAANAGVFLSIGTSGLVHPAAALPLVARDHGACLVEINPSETPLTARADLWMPLTARGALSGLLARLDF